MTPAEQGQERWTIRLDRHGVPCQDSAALNYREIEVVPAADKQALEKELEMCQRYWPFMRRSRDEAKRKLSALRDAAHLDAEEQDAKLSACEEELAAARTALEAERSSLAVDARVEAAETARDEAVKRERGLEAELEKARENHSLDFNRLSNENRALVEALENALAADTESETRHIIYAALDQSGKP